MSDIKYNNYEMNGFQVAQLSLSDPPPPVNITIPNYELRGSGRDSHYEYEVKVSSEHETCWSYLGQELTVQPHISEPNMCERKCFQARSEKCLFISSL